MASDAGMLLFLNLVTVLGGQSRPRMGEHAHANRRRVSNTFLKVERKGATGQYMVSRVISTHLLIGKQNKCITLWLPARASVVRQLNVRHLTELFEDAMKVDSDEKNQFLIST